MEVLDRCNEEVVGLVEHELRCERPVDKNPIDSRCPIVSRRVVFSSKSCSKHRVHEHVLNGVNVDSSPVSEAFVYSPCVYALQDFLVACS